MNKTIYRAHFAVVDGRQAGKMAYMIGMIISNCYSSAKKKLRITVVGQSICPDCEKKTSIKKDIYEKEV